MKQVNDYILKLTGKASLLQELELGNSYKVSIDGEVTTVTDSNNQDGTVNRIYKFEPILVTLEKDNGETIKAKDIRSRSKQLRNLLWKRWQEESSDIEFEEYYDKKMVEIIKNA